MRVTHKFTLLMLLLLLSPVDSENALAQIKPKTTGLGLRGSYWNMRNSSNLRFDRGADHEAVDLGGAGGWLHFFSRTSDSWFIEFHLGAVADLIEHRQHLAGEDSRVLALAPVLLGLRHPLVSPANPSALRPYIAFGGGPYWIADIIVLDRYSHQETLVDSKLYPGAYAGGGLEFMLSSNFGLSFDVKYHFVDLAARHEYSGYEYAVGMQFYWGDYKENRQ